MYSLSSNSKYKYFLKKAFAVFLLVGILNWALTPKVLIYAEEEVAPASSEAPVEAPAPIEAPAEPTGVAEASVETGDAVASSDVLNEVNTNEVNSEGEIILISDSLGDTSIDLRGVLASSTASSTCSLCDTNTTIENQNTATTTNDITVSADSGSNIASSTATSTVVTGDALAGSNLVNVVNTNIVDSQYTLLVFNNFGDWSGDLVLPNADFFGNFLSVFNPDCDCAPTTNILNSNTASVQTAVSTSAETGDNTASGGSIMTGNALAASNVYNLVNTNLYNTSTFYLLVKVFGDWSGNIFNLPKGLAWQETPEGILIHNSPNDAEGSSSSSGSSSNLGLNNENEAVVENNVSVEANTGGNQAQGDETIVRTGDAFAASNLVNIVNTNIISSNWFTALVNILGDWDGNISFGQPDLWVGTVASVNGKTEAGSSVHFTTTVVNNGDARASDVNVLALLKSSHFQFMGNDENFYLHHIDKLDPGESLKFEYFGMVERIVPDDPSPVLIDISVSSFETDNDTDDNIDRISFGISYNPGAAILPLTSFASSYPDLEVVKTHTVPDMIVVDGVEMVPAGGSVDYKIVVKNHGGSAFEGILFDELKNEEGELISEQSWELGHILPNEEITITYTTEFLASSTPGTYTNSAWVEALGGDYDSFGGTLAKEADSNIASDEVILTSTPVMPTVIEEVEDLSLASPELPEVLGLFTENLPSLDTVEYLPALFLGGFCSAEEGNSSPMNLSHSMLLGSFFVLFVQNRKRVPSNLFLF